MENPKSSLGQSSKLTKEQIKKTYSDIIWQTSRDAQPTKPAMYGVMLLNDDSTPMDFVVEILKEQFFKTMDEAVDLMLAIHQNGEGTAGTFTREIAETKVAEVIECSRRFQHPLKCLMRKVKV